VTATPAPEALTAASTSKTKTPHEVKPERLFTLAQIREAGRFSRSTVYRLRHGGGLRTVTIGGVVRVRESDWQAFLEKSTEGAAP